MLCGQRQTFTAVVSNTSSHIVRGWRCRHILSISPSKPYLPDMFFVRHVSAETDFFFFNWSTRHAHPWLKVVLEVPPCYASVASFASCASWRSFGSRRRPGKWAVQLKTSIVHGNMGVSWNGGIKNGWFMMKDPKMDDLGVLLLMETTILEMWWYNFHWKLSLDNLLLFFIVGNDGSFDDIIEPSMTLEVAYFRTSPFVDFWRGRADGRKHGKTLETKQRQICYAFSNGI